MASLLPITIPAHVRWLLPTALITTAATLGACTFEHTKIAQPGAYDRCVQRTDDGFGNTVGNTIAGNIIGNTTGVTTGNTSGSALDQAASGLLCRRDTTS
jgi:hypothetical protein